MHMLENADIIMTGGAGTLGRAIAERRKREGWTGKLTVYSTDNHKHAYMRGRYPDVQFIQGDVRNPETLYNAMVGHDIVLHLAAVKVIPDSELWTLDTIDVNVNGSINVCVQAINAGISHVVGISTDKAAHPANAYGATKMLMEKVFQEYARVNSDTQFHLVRYGNVLESTGSVIEAWKKSVELGEKITITDPMMTRFFLSPQQAVDLVIHSLELPSGHVYIPKLKSLSIGKLAEHVLGNSHSNNPNTIVLGDGYTVKTIPIRPGEKIHECLLTRDEEKKAMTFEDHFDLPPSTDEVFPYHVHDATYTSDKAPELTRDELMELLKNG